MPTAVWERCMCGGPLSPTDEESIFCSAACARQDALDSLTSSDRSSKSLSSAPSKSLSLAAHGSSARSSRSSLDDSFQWEWATSSPILLYRSQDAYLRHQPHYRKVQAAQRPTGGIYDLIQIEPPSPSTPISTTHSRRSSAIFPVAPKPTAAPLSSTPSPSTSTSTPKPPPILRSTRSRKPLTVDKTSSKPRRGSSMMVEVDGADDVAVIADLDALEDRPRPTGQTGPDQPSILNRLLSMNPCTSTPRQLRRTKTRIQAGAVNPLPDRPPPPPPTPRQVTEATATLVHPTLSIDDQKLRPIKSSPVLTKRPRSPTSPLRRTKSRMQVLGPLPPTIIVDIPQPQSPYSPYSPQSSQSPQSPQSPGLRRLVQALDRDGVLVA